MKNLVRAFVVALVLTGAVASTHTATASAKTIAAPLGSKLNAVPTCAPDGSQGDCGMGSIR